MTLKVVFRDNNLKSECEISQYSVYKKVFDPTPKLMKEKDI